MAHFEISEYEVPAMCRVVYSDAMKISEYWRATNDQLGEVMMLNEFLPRDQKITYKMVLEADPEFDGTLTQTLVDRIVRLYPEIEISFGVWKDDQLILVNTRDRQADRWAVFGDRNGKLLPVWVDGGSTFEMERLVSWYDPSYPKKKSSISPPPGLPAQVPEEHPFGYVDNPQPEVVPQYQAEDYIVGASGQKILVRSMNSTRKEEQLMVDEWFFKRVVVQVRGDGKCGLYAMYQAMRDAGIRITELELHHDLIMEASRTRPDGDDCTSWYTMEEMINVAEKHHVELYVKVQESHQLQYWITRGGNFTRIGLTCDGSHYNWVKMVNSPPISLSVRDTVIPEEDEGESQDSSTGPSSIAGSFTKHASSRRYSFGSSKWTKGGRRKHQGKNYTWDIPCTNDCTIKIPIPEDSPYKSLQDSKNWKRYPQSLIDFINMNGIQDPSVTYSHPTILDQREDDDLTSWPDKPRVTKYIPKRMDNALMRLPDEIAQAIVDSTYKELKHIQPNWVNSIVALARLVPAEIKGVKAKRKEVVTEINVLKSLCLQSYSRRSPMISKVMDQTARLYTAFDMTNTMKSKMNPSTYLTEPTELPSMLLLLQRVRICLGLDKMLSEDADSEYVVKFHDCGSYSVRQKGSLEKFCLIVSGGLFYLSHEGVQAAFIGTVTYLDYCITFCEVRWTLDSIISSMEFSWLRPLGTLMLEFSEMDVTHNSMVDFMKSYESFLLGITDLFESGFINWAPLMDTILSMIKSSNSVSRDTIELVDVIDAIFNYSGDDTKDNIFIRLIHAITHLDGLKLQEASTLHKFLFYAEVNTLDGLEKFLKRVHSPRPNDQELITKMIHYAKQQFVLNFVERHGSIPRMRGNEQKLAQLRLSFESRRMSNISAEPLEWWSDIEPFNCLDDTSSHNVLEVAKDKGALLPEISFGPGDSRKELLQLLETNKTDYSELDLSIIPPPLKQSIRRIRSDRISRKHKYPARLIAKEKEQKIEARLFGNAPLDTKHGLSFKMLKAKKALTYYTSEIMTKSDKARKLKLHNMAQELNQEGAYTLLLDIEGHNQSMQGPNCSELYSFVGKLFGEEDWDKLADYFSNLTVYHYDEFYNDSIISRGQLGGIEGWMNPLWTLHTVILTEMISTETDIHRESCSVYSDDVAMVIRLKEVTTEALNNVFVTMRNHYLRGGMVVKLSQTSVTKNRITMLRIHYFKGQRSDNTLKRLLAASVMNNGVIISDELETSGVNSSCSSAMELSESILTITYVKWQKAVFINMRAFASLLSKKRPENNILTMHMPRKYQILLWTEPGDVAAYLKNEPQKIKSDMIKRATQLGLQDIFLDTDRDLQELMRALYGNAPGELLILKSRDCVYHCLTEERWIQDLLYFILISQSSLGGRGVSQCISDILSGHSDGTVKNLSYTKEWIDRYAEDPLFYYRTLEAQLSLKQEQIDGLSAQFFCQGTWPLKRSINTTSSRLSGEITKYMKKTNVNGFISDLLDLVADEDLFKKTIIEANGEKVYPRILQFYYEHSVYYLRDLLVRKVETSSGFLTQLHGLKRLRASIMQKELFNMINLFECEEVTFGQFSQSMGVYHYLDARNKFLFPGLSLCIVPEPLYDHLLTENDVSNPMFTVVKSSVTTYEKGLTVYKPPSFGNDALYKGELIESGGLFDGIEEVLCAKLVAITQWMLQNSNALTLTGPLGNRYALINLCDVSLSTLCPLKYLDILPYIPLAKGGEIFHRLPNMRYKTSAICRALPRSINSFTVSIHQETLHNRNLADSNCHFDYVRQRLKICHVMREKYLGDSNVLTVYGLILDGTIFDVSTMRIDHESKTPITNWLPYSKLTKRRPKFRRINQFSKNLTMNLSDTEMWTVISVENELNEDLAMEILIDNKILSYYKQLKKNFMSFSYRVDTVDVWTNLIKELRYTLEIFDDMTDDDLLYYIRGKLKNMRKTKISERTKSSLGLEVDIIRQHLRTMFSIDEFTVGGFLDRMRSITKRKESDSLNTRAKEIELIRSREVKQYLTDYINARQSVVVFIVIETCGVYEVIEDKIRINREATIKSLHVVWSNPALLFDDPLLGIALMDTLFPDHDDFINLLKARDIFDDLDTELRALHPLEYMNSDNTTKIKTVTTNARVMAPPVLVESIKYAKVRVGWEALRDSNTYSRIMKTARFVADLYSHPIVYWSLTGSDSYTCQYAYFKELKKSGVLSKYDKLCDLTAGRGEGHLALTHLGIKHDSFFRKDIFTAVYNSGNIYEDGEYDIFDPSTLELCQPYNLIHMDVSFTGSRTKSINSTLLHFMKAKQAFSLRVNSVMFNPGERPLLEGYSGYRLVWYYPIRENLKPYQMYLLGYPTTSTDLPEKTIVDPKILGKTLIGNYIKTIHPSNLYYLYNEDVLNSSTILLTQDQDYEELCRILLDDESTSLLKRRILNVTSNKGLLSSIMIPYSMGKINKGSSVPKDRFVELTTLPEHYKEYRDLGVGGKNKNKRVFWTKAKIELYDTSETKLHVLITENNRKLLERLTWDHPIPKVRGLISDLLFATDYSGGSLEAPYDRLMESLGKIIIREEDFFDSSTIAMRRAILLLYYSASVQNYSFGVSILWSYLSNDNYPVKMRIDMLKQYRRCSYLFFKFSERSGMGGFDTDILKKIRETILIPHLKSKIVRPQKTTAQKSHRMDDVISNDELITAFRKSIEITTDPVSFVKSFTDAMLNSDMNPMISHKDPLSQMFSQEEVVDKDLLGAEEVVVSQLSQFDVSQYIPSMEEAILDIPEDELFEMFAVDDYDEDYY